MVRGGLSPNDQWLADAATAAAARNDRAFLTAMGSAGGKTGAGAYRIVERVAEH